jgi:hypothetical protein
METTPDVFSLRRCGYGWRIRLDEEADAFMAQSNDLPLPDYDQMSLGDLRHRIRSLDEDSLAAVLVHEAGHAARVPVLEILEARQRELEAGAEPSSGDPRRAPGVEGPSGGSPVQESTAAQASTPLRHGVANQTPKRGRS